jgi:hypothetical protein
MVAVALGGYDRRLDLIASEELFDLLQLARPRLGEILPWKAEAPRSGLFVFPSNYEQPAMVEWSIVENGFREGPHRADIAGLVSAKPAWEAVIAVKDAA